MRRGKLTNRRRRGGEVCEMGIVSESRQEAGKRQPHPHGGNWKGLVRECLGLEHDLHGMNTVQDRQV